MEKKVSAYEKEIKQALKKSGTYERSFDMYIRRAAMIATIIDKLWEDIMRYGTVIENKTREGNIVKKKNPACDDLPKMTNQYNLYMQQLGLSPKSMIGSGEEDEVSKLERKVNSIS